MQFQITSVANDILTALAFSCLLIAYVLSLILIRKYRKKRSKAVLFLMSAFLLFIAAGIAALPINVFTDYTADKWTYMVTKIIITFASLFFLKFIIEVFAPDKTESPSVSRLLLLFVVINITLVVMYHAVEVHIYTTTGVKFSIIWLLVIQELAMALPFSWLGYLALKTAARDPIIKERRAIQFIALSGLALCLFFVFNAVNEAIGLPNYWTFPMWACGIVSVVCFFIGLVRPGFIFNRYGG